MKFMDSSVRTRIFSIIMLLGLGLSLQASAKTLHIDKLNDTKDQNSGLQLREYKINNNINEKGVFTDFYSFTLAQDSRVTIDLQDKDHDKDKDKKFKSLSFGLAPGTFDAFSFDADGSVYTFTLQQGVTYVLGITGEGTGHYKGDLNVSAVPLPAAFWLFATAVVGFVSLAKRQRRRSASRSVA